MQQRREVLVGHLEALVISRRKRGRFLHDLHRHVVAKQHRRRRRAEVGECDERPAAVVDRHARKMPARRCQGALAKVAMDNAEVGRPFEEHAPSIVGALEHRRRLFRKIGTEYER